MNAIGRFRYETAFDYEVERLWSGDEEKISISKSKVPALPDYFEEHYPANEMQNDGAIASYRDNRERNSLHVIEYEDHWTVHVDDHNPKYAPVKHLTQDAPAEGALLAIAAAGILYKLSGE